MLPSARRTLVTGASRPIGLETVRQCLERGDRVIAAARNPARSATLADLRAKYGTLELIALEPADAASVAEAVPIIESLTSSLDLLVITPGEPGSHERSGDVRDDQFESISAIDLVEHFRRHAVAPLLLVRTLLPMLTAGENPRVLFVDDDRANDGAYASNASRAALQTMVQLLAAEVAESGVTVTSAFDASDASVAIQL